MAGGIGEAEAWRQNVCFICYLVIKIAESLTSVHIEMFLGQSKSKASMLECPWSQNDCVELSQTLLEESVPATRKTTWSVLKGEGLESWVFAADPQSTESSQLVGRSLCK